MKKEARYYTQKEDGGIRGGVRCGLCPHRCVIAKDKTGICGVRVNREGTLYTNIYGEVSSIAMDPIEKKPLYHFYPGASILSIGTVGCSFKCQFCQNYGISQDPAHPTDYYPPEEMVRLAAGGDSIGIAYTYSEPLIWFEYVLDCCKLAREQGLKNVFVTNGYVNPEPLAELLGYADAFNIDLKSMSGDFYKTIVGGRLDPVMRTIRAVSEKEGVTLEVTTLIIPGYNDSDEEMEEIAEFLSSLGRPVPYHLSAYYPMYKFTAPPTPVETLERLQRIAEKKLDYVYLGNVRTDANTSCPSCGAVLVERRGYGVRRVNLGNGRCDKCGEPVPMRG